MTAQIDRLKEAIRQRGYESAADFARAVGEKEGTLRAQMARGSIPKDVAEKYARRLGVTVAWLLYNNGPAVPANKPTRPKPIDARQANRKKEVATKRGDTLESTLVRAGEETLNRSAVVYEMDVRASAGAGAVVDNEDVKDLWAFPEIWVRTELQTAPSNLRLATVEGDSMVSDPPKPTDIYPGDKVIVDIADRTVSPPGIFMVHDGMGLVAKRCEYIPHSDPPRARIISNNPKYATYEVAIDEAYCMGRIKARWERLS